MKIRKKLLILLGLPICLQVLSTSVLLNAYKRVDELAGKELQAKRVISNSIEIRASVLKGLMLIANQGMSGFGITVDELQLEEIKNSYAGLRRLAGKDLIARKLIDKTESDTYKFVRTFKDLSSIMGDDGSESEKLIKSQESVIALFTQYKSIQDDTENLIKHFAPIAAAFHPKAMAAREQIRMLLIVFLLANLLLVVIFSIVLNRSILSRLLILLNNIKEFALTRSSGSRLDGDDELKDIDSAFQSMSQELQKQEEIRQSMRAILSNDLRLPLASMKNKLSDLESICRDANPKLLSDIRIISSETDRLRRLTNTLLDIERLEDGSMKVETRPVPSRLIFNTSREAVMAQCKRKKIEIIEPAANEAMLNCDQDRSIQVLINLLSNAVKFAPKESQIELKLEQSGSNWRIEVLDSGPGVPEASASKLFAKFSQLEQEESVKKQGSGLGLYICKMLIENQGGQVGYRPREEKGSCFWFELPSAIESKLSALLICFLAGCCIQAIVFPQASSATQSAQNQSKQTDWRKIIRDARVDFNYYHEYSKDECARAISAYKRALEILESSEPQNEAILDLYLNLAEVKRLNKEPEEAARILKQLEPEIFKRDLIDPVIKVRFWRRKALVCLSLNKSDAATECFIKATETLKNLMPDSPIHLELLNDLLLVSETKDWQNSERLIALLRKTAPNSKKTEAHSVLCINIVKGRMKSDFADLLATGKLEKARELLDIMNSVSIKDSQIPDLANKLKEAEKRMRAN